MNRWLSYFLPAVLAVLPAISQAQSYVLVRGADTLATERVTRRTDHLEGELRLHVPGGVTIRYGGEITADQRIPRLETEAVIGTGAPAKNTVTFEGDSVTIGGSGGEQRLFAGAGALPYINLSSAILEQVILRARAIGGERVEVQLLNLSGGRTFQAVVERMDGDSVRVMIASVEVRARIDPSGRLLGAHVPAQGITLHRVDTPVGAARPRAPATSPAPEGATYAAASLSPRAERPGGVAATVPDVPAVRVE